MRLDKLVKLPSGSPPTGRSHWLASCFSPVVLSIQQISDCSPVCRLQRRANLDAATRNRLAEVQEIEHVWPIPSDDDDAESEDDMAKVSIPSNSVNTTKEFRATKCQARSGQLPPE